MLPLFRIFSFRLSVIGVVATARAQAISEGDLQAMRGGAGGGQPPATGPRRCRGGGDPRPARAKVVRWADYARPGRRRQVRRNRRLHREEPELAAAEGVARACRGGDVAGESDAVAADWLKRHPPMARQAGRGPPNCMIAAATSSRDGGIARDLGRGRFQCRPDEHSLLAATRRPIASGGRRAAARPADVGRQDRGRLSDAAAGAGRLPRTRPKPGWRWPHGAQRRSDAGPRPAGVALRSGAPLRTAALAAQEGHDRRRGRNSAGPARRSRCARRLVAERQIVARKVLATGNADLAYRLTQQHGLIDGNALLRRRVSARLHCASL